MTKFFDRLDRRLVLLVLGLLVAGTVLVFGASAYELGLEEQTPYAKVLGHLQKGLLALLVCATVATVPYRKTARVAEWGLWISIFGLLLLLTPLPIVRASAGIPRWLDLGPIVVQPSEFAKLSLVLTLPLWIDRDPARLTRGPKEQLRLIAPFLAIAFLLAMQPNYGSIVAIGTIVMGVLWVGGLSLRYFLFGGTAVFFAAWFGFTHVSKLVSRLDAWMVKFSHIFRILQAFLYPITRLC